MTTATPIQYETPWPSTTLPPSPPATTEAVGVGAPPASTGTLPRTGSDLTLVAVALVLVFIGFALLAARKAATRRLS